VHFITNTVQKASVDKYNSFTKQLILRIEVVWIKGRYGGFDSAYSGNKTLVAETLTYEIINGGKLHGLKRNFTLYSRG
jgi:hypothetical protein